MARNKIVEELNIAQQLENMTEIILQLNQKINAMEYQPPYIKFLIDEGYILPNKSVVKKLDYVACAICDNFPNIPVTRVFLSQFLHDGKPYSRAAIEQAITLAYTR